MILLGKAIMWMLLYSDDYKWVASGPDALLLLLVSLFVLDCLGVPISYKKVKGGFQMEWVGYAMDYGTFSAGISEARATWLVTWLEAVIQAKAVVVSDFESVLGRLGFAAGALERTRPFLSFGYAWVHSVPRHAKMTLPMVLLLTLQWIMRRLQRGERLQCFRAPRVRTGE